MNDLLGRSVFTNISIVKNYNYLKIFKWVLEKKIRFFTLRVIMIKFLISPRRGSVITPPVTVYRDNENL